MMRTYNGNGTRRASFLTLALIASAFIMLLPARPLHAQYFFKWLAIGSYTHNYCTAGCRNEEGRGFHYPAIQPYSTNFRSQGMWISITGEDGEGRFTDEAGKTWDVMTAHRGPRESGLGQFFGMKIEMTSKFDPPVVVVDGLECFNRVVVNEIVDPTLKADRMILTEANTAVGISLTRKVYAWSQEYHDNYHILEYTFTNTGNIDDDAEIELEQDLKGVWFYCMTRLGISNEAHALVRGAAWGRIMMNDVVMNAVPREESGYPDFDDSSWPVDFNARFGWLGHDTEGRFDWSDIGCPVINRRGSYRYPPDDTTGRLCASQFLGRVNLHTDESATSTTNDPTQPYTTAYLDNDEVIFASNPMTDVAGMNLELESIDGTGFTTSIRGHQTPFHADVAAPPDSFPAGMPWAERMALQRSRPNLEGIGGTEWGEGYGPYDLPFGESITFTVAEGASGLGRTANAEIGALFKAEVVALGADGGEAADLPYPGPDGTILSKTKNEWVMTSRDSLFQTFERAIDNYALDGAIPEAPYPPKLFTVTSDTGSINLSWELYGAGPAVTGFEIWRAKERVNSTYYLITPGGLGPAVKSYEDEDVARGVSHFYYIQAVGDAGDNEETANTPAGALKSNRYWTQAYFGAMLKRPYSNELEKIRIVPNPFNVAAAKEVRWPDKQDKLGFLEIPAQCTINIYTEVGELIRELDHTDGSGDEYWDLTTYSRQLAVSGIYFAVITNKANDEQIIKKFVIIR